MASVNTVPNRLAKNPMIRVEKLGARGKPRSSPNMVRQYCSWRSSALAMASRISFSSPSRLRANSRYTAASARSLARYCCHRRICFWVGGLVGWSSEGWESDSCCITLFRSSEPAVAFGVFLYRIK